ncbi:MAG: glucose/arabinose dehydrogenase [Candidatus Azotimanducaceae bacterium]|jgi:glucose/arabinose dehydrogenase
MNKLISLFALLLICLPASADYSIETVAEGFDHPWSISFLPDGGYLVTTRPGEVYRVTSDGDKGKPLTGTPSAYVAGQGGYFDIILDPDFAINQMVYLSYAGGTPEANGTYVMRAMLGEQGFEKSEVIFSATPTKDTAAHYGGKLAFLPDGTLLVTTGDGFEYREAAQNKNSQLGKLIRINSDGSVPADNPFVNGGGDPKVYSYGHRNPQGLVVDTATGDIYVHEHGPKGGDELNLIAPAANYGWPAVTYGDNYSGAYVSPLKTYSGITEPLHYWVPSIAPSGLAYYDGQVFPQWQGDLFVGALVDKDVRRLDMENGKVVSEEALFSEIAERIRDVRAGPDGNLYLLTDSATGKILRIAAP